MYCKLLSLTSLSTFSIVSSSDVDGITVLAVALVGSASMYLKGATAAGASCI
jgi:hypothetical protein